jgi:hypothetical protein
MTREEAVLKALTVPSRVLDRLREYQPQWLCDRLQMEAAEDQVDMFIAFGLLQVEQPSPQESE